MLSFYRWFWDSERIPFPTSYRQLRAETSLQILLVSNINNVYPLRFPWPWPPPVFTQPWLCLSVSSSLVMRMLWPPAGLCSMAKTHPTPCVLSLSITQIKATLWSLSLVGIWGAAAERARWLCRALNPHGTYLDLWQIGERIDPGKNTPSIPLTCALCRGLCMST